MPNNPLGNRKFTPPAAKPRGGPTLEQINRILEAASDARRTVIAVASFAGVRIGEVTRLRVEDVDFKGNWLRIESRPGYETKSGDTWKVPLHSRLRTILEQVPHGKSGWFFTAQPSRKYPLGDHHINPKLIGEDFTKVLESLEISAGRKNGFTFHSLRSSFKIICIHAGVPREVVDVWQNHAPDRAASHVYYKLSDEESQRFMRIVPFGNEE
jgi:integrase